MGLWMVGRRVGGGGRIGGALLLSVFVSFGDVVSGSLAGAGAVMAGSVRFSTGAASVTIKLNDKSHSIYHYKHSMS